MRAVQRRGRGVEDEEGRRGDGAIRRQRLHGGVLDVGIPKLTATKIPRQLPVEHASLQRASS